MQKKSAKLKRVGALKGRWRVDCKKKVQNQEGWGIKGLVEGGLQKKSGKLKRVGASKEGGVDGR